jgi:membrane-associated phospholipid phosphatase
MGFLTDFADEAVILPLAAAVGIALGVIGWWRGCLAWAISVGGALATMGFLKVLFVACAGSLGDLGILSPSGHTAAAAVTYGGIALLLGRGRLPKPLLMAAPLAVAVVIGISRVVLHAHVPAEVFLGGCIGLVGASILLPLAGPRPPMKSWPIITASGLIVFAFHGSQLQAEQAIHNFAYLSWLQLSSVCIVAN